MEYKEPNRVPVTIKVKIENRAKLMRLKQYNPETPWDILLEPVLKDIKLPKRQCASTKLPPIYHMEIRRPPDID